MQCPKCGTEVQNAQVCPNCGTPLTYQNSAFNATQAAGFAPQNSQPYYSQPQPPQSGIVCPKCGSTNVVVQAVTQTTGNSKTKGFGWIKSCLGFLLFSFPGILCGLCGFGKSKSKTKTEIKTVRICQNCGNQF